MKNFDHSKHWYRIISLIFLHLLLIVFQILILIWKKICLNFTQNLNTSFTVIFKKNFFILFVYLYLNKWTNLSSYKGFLRKFVLRRCDTCLFGLLKVKLDNVILIFYIFKLKIWNINIENKFNRKKMLFFYLHKNEIFIW